MSRLLDSLAFRALCAAFPSVGLAPRSRFLRARLALEGARFCGPFVLRWVPLCDWCGPLGLWLVGVALRRF
jgi:hypothetical protein